LIDMTKFGQKIVELRNKANMRQRDLAEYCSVSPQAVSKWEHGKSCPDIALLDEIAAALGVSINDLFATSQY